MTASFSPLAPRTCAWCQRPLQGRSDKRFCSAACRGQGARHGGAEGAPIDWPARAQQAEQTVRELQTRLAQLQQDQQAVAALERDYDHLSQVLGSLIPDVPLLGTLTHVRTYVEELLQHYHRHPGLSRGEPGAQRRLQAVQWVQAALVQQQTRLQAAKQPTGRDSANVFSLREEEPTQP